MTVVRGGLRLGALFPGMLARKKVQLAQRHRARLVEGDLHRSRGDDQRHRRAHGRRRRRRTGAHSLRVDTGNAVRNHMPISREAAVNDGVVPHIRVMTFNVRYDSDEDGAHSWQHRRADVLDIVRAHDPDLISLQEPDASQWNDICGALAGYAPFGVFDDGPDSIEAYGGLFRAQRFDCDGDGVFWLSRTPSVPHSVSWNLDWEPRACGWTRLRDRATDRALVFAATHFDTNANGWLPSAETLHRELDVIAGNTPIVLAGDFNCAAGSEAHRYLLTEGGFRDAWYETGHSDARRADVSRIYGTQASARRSRRTRSVAQDDRRRGREVRSLPTAHRRPSELPHRLDSRSRRGHLHSSDDRLIVEVRSAAKRSLSSGRVARLGITLLRLFSVLGLSAQFARTRAAPAFFSRRCE